MARQPILPILLSMLVFLVRWSAGTRPISIRVSFKPMLLGRGKPSINHVLPLPAATTTMSRVSTRSCARVHPSNVLPTRKDAVSTPREPAPFSNRVSSNLMVPGDGMASTKHVVPTPCVSILLPIPFLPSSATMPISQLLGNETRMPYPRTLCCAVLCTI